MDCLDAGKGRNLVLFKAVYDAIVLVRIRFGFCCFQFALYSFGHSQVAWLVYSLAVSASVSEDLCPTVWEDGKCNQWISDHYVTPLLSFVIPMVLLLAVRRCLFYSCLSCCPHRSPLFQAYVSLRVQMAKDIIRGVDLFFVAMLVHAFCGSVFVHARIFPVTALCVPRVRVFRC